MGSGRDNRLGKDYRRGDKVWIIRNQKWIVKSIRNGRRKNSIRKETTRGGARISRLKRK